MARPTRPAAPSRRVFIAFAVALLLGMGVFVVFWATGRAPASQLGDADAERKKEEGRGKNDTGVTQAEPLPRGGTLDAVTNDLDAATTRLMHAPLVRVDRRTGDVEPWLAQSWQTAENGLVYALRLRDGLRWSDGTPLTPEDVVSSLQTIDVMGAPLAARVIPPNVVEIAFPAPFGPALRLLDAHPILPRHAPADRVGLGPFVPADPTTEDAKSKSPARTFARNPHYWRTAPDGSRLPYVDAITLRAGDAAALASVDLVDAPLAPDDIEAAKKLEAAGKVRLFDLGPGLDANALWFRPLAAAAGAPNTGGRAARPDDKPWLTSERFRNAISTAVDRREYCRQVFLGACDEVAGPVSPGNLPWFNPDLPIGRPNLDIARQTLADLGLRDRNGDGLLDDAAGRTVRFGLLVRKDVAAAVRAGAFLRDTLRAIGILVEVTPVDAATLRARREKRAYEAIYDRVEMRDIDPALNLDFWLSTGARHVWNTSKGPADRHVYDWERQIDAHMRTHAGTFDRAARMQAFVDAQRLYHRYMPAIFFGVPHVRIATSVRAVNAAPSILRPHLAWAADELVALR